MTLAAVLVHFDEPPAFLHRLVASLAGKVDALVAVDGRWRHHGDGTYAVSPRSTLDALRDACEQHDVHGVLITRETPWESQVDKRDWAMLIAQSYGDWLLVIDGDCTLERFDAAAVRAALQVTDLDVAEVTVRNLNRPWPFQHLAEQVMPARLIYRAGARVVGPAHNDLELGGVRLNGDPLHGDLAPALDLASLVEVAHDNRNRGDTRNGAAAAYRRARRANGIEARA